MSAIEKSSFKQGLIAAAEAVVASKDELTRADQAIGDGDHGVGMARGFRAFADALAKLEGEDAASCLQAGGKALMMASGGASGAIFGTFFLASGKALQGGDVGVASLAGAFAAGLQAVRDRGKAKAGDKTMIDAAEPAVEALASRASAPLSGALSVMAEAARGGMEATRDMVATTGKARALGERSLGHPDPGAMTFTIFCEALATRMA